MKECKEWKVKIGLIKKPEKIFDEIERITASMIREGWLLTDYIIEDGLRYAHLFFEREINCEELYMN
ncbi:MAG: hypothetical protein N2053_00250 [Chitinispirillaceae bacterium]|nr:hypothetical protein [Chitinispirillaceae bacterium]